MIAIKASTEAMTPKMMVPVESELDSIGDEAMVEFMAGNDLNVKVVLSAGMVAVVDSLVTLVDENVELLSGSAETRAVKVQYLFGGNEAAWQSPSCCACSIYAQFVRILVVASHILRHMRREARRTTREMPVRGRSWWSIWMDHQNRRRYGSVAKPSMPGAAGSSEPCKCLYFVIASWGGALELNLRTTELATD
jgi:hypothetical protein